MCTSAATTVRYRIDREGYMAGIHILNLGATWEKLMVAARVIAAIENPADVYVSK